MRVTVEVSDGAVTSVTTSPPATAQPSAMAHPSATTMPGATAPPGAAADMPVINAGPAPAAKGAGTAAVAAQGVSTAAPEPGQDGISAGPARALPQ